MYVSSVWDIPGAHQTQATYTKKLGNFRGMVRRPPKKRLTARWQYDTNRLKRGWQWVGLHMSVGGGGEPEQRFGLSRYADDWKRKMRDEGHELLQRFVALFFIDLFRPWIS